MPGLVPGIHVLAPVKQEDVDGRDIGERKRRRPSDGYARPRRYREPSICSDSPHSRRIRAMSLALRELERFARLGTAVLLALDHARIPGEEAALLQDSAQIRLE